METTGFCVPVDVYSGHRAQSFSSIRRRPVCSRAPLSIRSSRSARWVVRCCDNATPPSDSSPEYQKQWDLDADVRRAFEKQLNESMKAPSSPVDELDTGREKTLDGLVADGKQELKAIGDDVVDDLDAVQRELAQRAEEMVTEEMEEALSKFDEQRAGLLKNVVAQRNVIEEEAGRIQELADSLGRGGMSRTASDSPRHSALFAVSGLLAVAALYYGWVGVTESSSSALQNSALDAVAAAAASYLSKRGEAEGNGAEADSGDK